MTRVLVVDDEPSLRRLARRFLAHLGHEVSEAGDGFEALATFEQAPPDFLITDICMARMDGLQLLAALRARGFGTPTIACTGADSTLLVKAIEAGACATLKKPFTLDELQAAVNVAIALTAITP